MKQILLYLLSAIAGGVVAVIALLVTVRVLARRSDFIGISFGRPTIKYGDVELLSYEKRVGGIYVSYRNRGDKPVTTAIFDIRVFDSEGHLVDQLEQPLYQPVPPGKTEEGIVKPEDYRRPGLVDITDKTVELRLKYAYVE